MKMRWFGEPWRAPLCEDENLRVPVPLGYRCAYCDVKFEQDDQGVVMANTGPRLDDTSYTLILDEELAQTGVPGRIQNAQQVIGQHLECFLDALGTPQRFTSGL